MKAKTSCFKALWLTVGSFLAVAVFALALFRGEAGKNEPNPIEVIVADSLLGKGISSQWALGVIGDQCLFEINEILSIPMDHVSDDDLLFPKDPNAVNAARAYADAFGGLRSGEEPTGPWFDRAIIVAAEETLTIPRSE